MNKKLFLGLWFVLFTILVLLVNWFFRIPLIRTEEIKSRLSQTDIGITRLASAYAEFLQQFEQEAQLFTYNETEIENEARLFTRNIREDLKHYKTIPYIKRNEEANSQMEDLASKITDVENNLNDFFLASHERGVGDMGLVSRWQSLSSKLLSAEKQPDKAIQSNLQLIKQLESEYIVSRDLKILENISRTAEEIRNNLSVEEGGIIPADVDNYMALTGNLMALDKRIGTSEFQGIAANLEPAVSRLRDTFDAMKITFTDLGKTTKIWWNIFKTITLLIITILCIFSFIIISNRNIFHPLQKLAGITEQLARGKIPDHNFETGRITEFQTIKDSILNHISSIRNKIDFTKAMNQGILDKKLDLAGNEDELGLEIIRLQAKIVETAENQARNDEENRIRRYMNEGLARFSDLLRTSSNDISSLGDVFIREMVKYLNAIQGGFFIFDDSDKASPVLNLVSAFAYNRKKYLQKSIAFGEGLVGTCAREKHIINITEIPAGYIEITSGLGDTLPDNLLLIPVMHENELIGVLEIASLKKYQDYEVNFSQEVARNLGSTIVYTRNNQRTSELLNMSQQQALEMAEQEEEMRQNMEELKATQEESNRREDELRGFAGAIRNTFLIIEYDLKGTIIDVNEKLCGFLRMHRDDMIGKTHADIFNGQLTTDPVFWEGLENNGQQLVTENILVGKKTYRLIEHFTTVFQQDNIAVKFINFATDDRAGNS